MKNGYIFSAGVICAITALIHTIGGQLDLVTDLLNSNMDKQAQTEWLGAWHMVTVVLFTFAYYLLKAGRTESDKINAGLLNAIAIQCILFSIVFIVASIVMQVFAPQWTLLLPIGILILLGLKKSNKQL